MDFNGLVYGMTSSPGNPITTATIVINDYLNTLAPRRVSTLGLVRTAEGWQPTAAARQHPRVILAIDYILRNLLNITEVMAVKMGRGVARFPAVPAVASSVLVWWNMSIEDLSTSVFDGAPNVSTALIVGEDWPNQRYLQALQVSKACHECCSERSVQVGLPLYLNFRLGNCVCKARCEQRSCPSLRSLHL